MIAIVLSLYDRTGVMVDPWRRAGYECWIVDLQHPEGITRDELHATREHECGFGELVTVGADARTWLPPRRDYAAFFAFPPCTDQSVSGARWFKDKGLAGLAGAVEMVERARDIAEWTGAPWMLENPVSVMSSYWRKPDAIVQPWHFAHYTNDPDAENYTKSTCLWTGGGFVLPQPKPADAPHRADIHLMPPSAERGDLRSVTPRGFAEAVFAANHVAALREVTHGR